MDFEALNSKTFVNQIGDVYEDPPKPDRTRSQDIQLPNALGRNFELVASKIDSYL